ncbi:MAG: hypothetical protein JSV25_10265 [Spirochaetota bacterium]|nr:MAG: hypothetical protein JSV25_10265 [Spirochaetota bacterium]
MKTLKLMITAVCVSVLALFLLGAECGVPVETVLGYYIMFKADDVQKYFDKGLTNYESEPFGNPVTSAEDYTVFFATPDEETGDEAVENGIAIMFDGTTIGTYTNTETIVQYTEDGIDVSGNADTVSVTKYDDEGGVIEGTFSGTIEGVVITEGQFRVKRVAKDTLLP